MKKLLITFLIFTIYNSIYTKGYSQTTSKPSASDDSTFVPKDIKVLERTVDKQGYIHTKIQYSRGMMVVTEITVTPPMPSISDRTKYNVDTMNLDSILVLVEKKTYNVAVLYKRKRIRQYRAVFGPDRLHDKMQEGDRKTPLGMFHVIQIRPNNSWKKFLLLDYPTQDSYKKFKEYKAEGLVPSNATIGSAVGIHGTASNSDKMVDIGLGWTDGCISLKYSDMDDFCQFIKVGTRVYIRN